MPNKKFNKFNKKFKGPQFYCGLEQKLQVKFHSRIPFNVAKFNIIVV